MWGLHSQLPFKNSDTMATTNENTTERSGSPVQNSTLNSLQNVASATGITGLTDNVVRNVTETQEFTKFTDSSLLISDNATIVGTQIDDVENTASVVSFLQRPCLLYYATLDANSIDPIDSFASLSTPALQPIVTSFLVPNATLNFGNRIQKITNFEWFKADTVFRILTNVQPFVAGRLWACFAPYDDDLEQQCKIRYKGRAAITSYPGVEIDLQSTNAAVIRIPWSGSGDAFSLTGRDKPIGRFYLFALTPIMAVGNPKIPMQIFSHFENISINGPTPLPVNLQGIAREAKGPVEEISGKIQDVSNSFKDKLAPIPIIGTIAQVVPWVAGAVKGVASIFGWSRPVEGSGSTSITNIPGRGYAQNLCTDSSTMLAFNNENQIYENEFNFLTNTDEMATNFICGRPGMVSSTKWLVDSIPQAEIQALQVGPYVNASRTASWVIGSTRYEVYDMTLFENMATLFGQWKADLHYRINVVRTPFHVGRFEVFFIPRINLQTSLSVEDIDTTNLYRHVVDISETNNIEFVIPYMHQNTMCSTGKYVNITNDTQSPGLLVVRALSPLSCPDTVSQYVTINIWAWATNVAFACPIGSGIEVPPVVELQGIVRNEEMGIDSVVFGKTNTPENLLHTTTTVGGEMAINMRQMTRAHRKFPNQVGNEYLINGNAIGGYDGYIGKMANIFAFYRGGLSFKLRPSLGTEITNDKFITTVLARTRGNAPIFGSNVEHTTYPIINPFHEVQLPFYNNTRRGICNYAPSNSGADSSTTIHPGVYIQTNVAQLDMYVGGKDDLTFGYLIGCPIYSTTVTPPSTKINKEEVVKAVLQGTLDFHNDTLSEFDESTIYYYGTTGKNRKSIIKNGFRSISGKFKLFKNRDDISKKKRVIYSTRVLKEQVVAVRDSYIITNDITELFEVQIYGHVHEFWKHARLQGLGHYNPLNFISNTNKLLVETSNVMESATAMIGNLSSTLENWKITVMGKEVQGLVLKISKVLVNTFMASKDNMLKAFFLNILMEFSSDVYNAMIKMVTNEVQLQGIADNFTELIPKQIMNKYCDTHGKVTRVALIALISCLFLSVFGLPSGNVDKMIKTMGDRARSIKNLSDFSGITVFSEVADNIIYSIFGTTSAPELDEYISGYRKWSEEVLEINRVEDPLSKRLEREEKLVFQIDRLYRQGIVFASQINSKQMKPMIKDHYYRVFKIIEEARKLCDYTGVFGNKPRVKPLLVQLFGESGVGKSGLTWPLAIDLNAVFCDSLEESKDFSKNIYVRQVGQVFWDGFHEQNIVIYDDFGQLVDTPAKPNEEYMEIIKAANIAPFPLHMAEISEKKNTKFTAKAIIMTSNVQAPNISSLNYPDAYRRRIDFSGRVINKEEYTKKGYSVTHQKSVDRLDVTKCKSAVDTDPYLIEVYDSESMKPTGEIIDYEQLVKLCVKTAKYNMDLSVNFNKTLESRLDQERFEMIKLQGLAQYAKDCYNYCCPSKESAKEVFYDAVEYINHGLEITHVFYDVMKAGLVSLFNEWITFKSALIAVGILLTGFGLFKYFNKEKKVWHNVQFDNREKATIEAVSGDYLTKRNRAVREAVSSDNITRKNNVVRSEATSGDNSTRKVILTREMNIVNDKKPITLVKEAIIDETKPKTQIVKESVLAKYDNIELQAWRDVNAQELITNRVLNNLYMISVKRGEEFVKVLQCLFIRDTIALCPEHLLLSVKENDTIRIENISGSIFELPFCKLKMQRIVNASGIEKDAMLLQFPRYIHAHSDLVKHFQLSPELSNRRANVCIPTLRRYNKNTTLTILGNTEAQMKEINYTCEKGDCRMRDAILYELNTINGDCGSPIICNETSMIRKIAGIHVAAYQDGSKAFGQSVTRKDLEIALERFECCITDVDNLPNIDLANVELQFNTAYTQEDYVKAIGVNIPTLGFFGKCTKNVFVPNKSDLQRSVLYGKLLEPNTAPSQLYNPNFDVMTRNFSKNAINTPYISDNEVNKAVSEVKALLLNSRDTRLARVLTYEEAIRGSDDSSYLISIERHSSPGYPWVLDRKAGCPGKTGWFGGDENFTYDESVREAVNERIERAKKGIRTPTVWCATLKDERRPIEKVQAGKTRVFSNGPQDFTIAFRQYFLGFQAHIMENRIHNEQSLGTNPYGIDWTTTAKKLKSKGKLVFAGDFSSFDGTLNTNIMTRFVDVVNEFYDDGPENKLIREVLFMDVYNSIQLLNGQFVGLTHSQPSGNPSTTVLNSFYNSVSMRIAFYRCVGNKYKFDDHVAMVSFGDDNVINLSDKIKEEFNQVEVTKAYASFGMIYTDEAKSGEVTKYRTLDNVAYLKRKFRKDGPIYRAPAPLDVIMETPNWYRKCTDSTEATKDNVVGSVEELAQHPEDIFNIYKPMLVNTFYKETNEYPEVYDYKQYNDSWNASMGLLDPIINV